MILAAVELPTTVAALKPYASLLELHNVVIFVVVLSILVPLALYRGPLNLHGMGAGIASVLIVSKVYKPHTVLGAFWGFNPFRRRRTRRRPKMRGRPGTPVFGPRRSW